MVNQQHSRSQAKSPEGKEIGTFTADKDTGAVTFTTATDKSYSGDVVPAVSLAASLR
ncbi:MAG: hypothetical protein ACLU4Q_06035 [Streptococcus thermophilus]